MFWLLLGAVEDEKISVEDPTFYLIATFGRIFVIAHVICTVIVALNMLIAMMNNSFDRIMVSLFCETNILSVCFNLILGIPMRMVVLVNEFREKHTKKK